MRTSIIALLTTAALGIAACAPVETSSSRPDVPDGSDVQLPEAGPTEVMAPVRSAQSGLNAYQRVTKRVGPVATQYCRQQNPSAPRAFCDFRIIAIEQDGQPPNAFQTIHNGQPILAFNKAMLQSVKNDDEIAFILSHEAGHQIAGHLARRNQNAQLGAILLGGLAQASGQVDARGVEQIAQLGGFVGGRAYSQSYELEADVIGTVIARQAGYDPRVGALSFRRVPSGGGLLSTHPPSERRLRTVLAKADELDGK
ncbi:M48 family metalloprotease [Paracoccaceae bacterium GXU_MW_L88]